MENFIRLVVSEDISNAILEARRQGKYNGKPHQFMKHLVLLGLREYRAQVEREALAACPAPEEPPHTGAKIIPFPIRQTDGTETEQPKGGIQESIESFLHEMGYIE